MGRGREVTNGSCCRVKIYTVLYLTVVKLALFNNVAKKLER